MGSAFYRSKIGATILEIMRLTNRSERAHVKAGGGKKRSMNRECGEPPREEKEIGARAKSASSESNEPAKCISPRRKFLITKAIFCASAGCKLKLIKIPRALVYIYIHTDGFIGLGEYNKCTARVSNSTTYGYIICIR